jgi:ribosomal protein S18 acetylase RimI-like enzyme
MISIAEAQKEDIQLLAEMGKASFIESHGHSADAKDINKYVNEKYTSDVFNEELNDINNIYHIISCSQQPAGYSKIIFNAIHLNIPQKNVTKLERLYLLKEFYGLKLGHELLKYNIGLSQKNGQAGMWLFVWKENHRAVEFYLKAGFKVIGSHDFKISETHSNPNHQMLLTY